MMKRIGIPLLATLLLLSPTTGNASPGTYPDGHGGEVFFPLGDASFADLVAAYNKGNPSPIDRVADPAEALGPPDHSDEDYVGYLTLGCAGELVLSFDDNALVDVAGPDLYVFEIGPDTEPTGLAVSSDGRAWTRVGRIAGGKAEIDLAPYVESGANFRYVKLVDLRSACGSGKTPGADIDAVGAIGSAQKVALDSAVLFDTGTYALRAEAFAAIDNVLKTVGQRNTTLVTVAGHTDAVGPASDNETLSRNRARAVADYLIDSAGFSRNRVTLEAHGETQPVADNATAEGRSRNRRVELTLRAPRSKPEDRIPRVDILGIWDAKGHGILELRKVDGEFIGEYTEDGGRLIGEFSSDTVFEGYWVENNSRKSCDTEKAGSDHWGPLKIEFESASRDVFLAHWRYCGETEWRGTWDQGERLL
jgi:outer membrane protein OmpA-like peptidoglycan-associated protein